MKAWPDRRILDLFGIELPIILAPMAGPGNAALAVAASGAAVAGWVQHAMRATEWRGDPNRNRNDTSCRTARPFNLNFFCHQPPVLENPERDLAWRALLRPYYLGFD